MITRAFLLLILHYEPKTGTFIWRERTPDLFTSGYRSAKGNCANWNANYAGTVAGRTNDKGYIIINIYRRGYRAHRLAWLWMVGRWPLDEIDHINGDPSDNRFANLREATHSQNLKNIRKRVSNTSGYKGVSWCKYSGKWRAIIRSDGRNYHIGRFLQASDASNAYQAAAERLHGVFMRKDRKHG